MYPFYETLEYAHQFKQAREEAEKDRARRGDIRKERRHARRVLAKPDHGLNMEKPGRWVGRYYQSSGAYRSAYSAARSEADYYSRSEW